MKRPSLLLVTSLLALLLSGCGEEPRPTTTPTTTSPSASPTSTLPAGIDQVVRFTINNKRVDGPSRVKVTKGDTVRLVITSDRDDEVHVHTFDNTVQVKAGVPTDVDVKATIAGVFEVELHSTHLLVTKLQVQ